MSTRRGFYSIYIHDEDMKKLMAISTWKKFKGWSYADIIEWILAEDEISDIIHKSIGKEKGE